MYARQQFFDYRDRPNKQLACLLSDNKGKQTIADIMTNAEGTQVVTLEDKRQLFEDYYTKLYKF